MYGKLLFSKVLILVRETWLLVAVKNQNKTKQSKAKQRKTKQNRTKQSTCFIFSGTFKLIVRIK